MLQVRKKITNRKEMIGTRRANRDRRVELKSSPMDKRPLPRPAVVAVEARRRPVVSVSVVPATVPPAIAAKVQRKKVLI